jgi:hypothetical protein
MSLIFEGEGVDLCDVQLILDPIENAIQSMIAKNREIGEAVEKFNNLKNQQQQQQQQTQASTPSQQQQQQLQLTLNVNHFTMLLKGKFRTRTKSLTNCSLCCFGSNDPLICWFFIRCD